MHVDMDNANLFSDDQMAILGCLAAIAACMLMMGLSFRFGTVNQAVEESDAQGVTGEETRRDSGRRAA
jgi:predicted transcriptional regulator